jgi:hypothetical protein
MLLPNYMGCLMEFCKSVSLYYTKMFSKSWTFSDASQSLSREIYFNWWVQVTDVTQQMPVTTTSRLQFRGASQIQKKYHRCSRLGALLFTFSDVHICIYGSSCLFALFKNSSLAQHLSDVRVLLYGFGYGFGFTMALKCHSEEDVLIPLSRVEAMCSMALIIFSGNHSKSWWLRGQKCYYILLLPKRGWKKRMWSHITHMYHVDHGVLHYSVPLMIVRKS